MSEMLRPDVTRPLRVLHLEDDPRDAELIRHKMEVEDIPSDIVLAAEKASFEAALARESFDLILCDYNVPGYDGISAIARARELQPDVPVIVISGTLGEEAAVKCLHMGATDYLFKDRLDRLALAVQRAIQEAEELRRRREAEKELRLSEAKFRALTEESLAGVSIIQDERFRYVNPALTGITGYSQEEMLAAASVLDLQVPEGDRPLVRENLRRRQDGETQHLRFNSRIRRKDGSLVTVDVFGSRILFEGSPAVMSTVLDITAREQAENALLASERRYAALVRDLEGIVWEANAQTFQFTFVSDFAERLLGYPVSRWFESTFWSDHIHPDDRDAAVNYCVERTRLGEAHQFEYRMIASDGRAVWLRDLVTVEVAGGRPTTLRGVMFDITERKRAEAQLREAQEQLNLAVSAGGVGIWTWDMRTNSAQVSPEFKRQIGDDDQENSMSRDEFESRVHPDDLDRIRAFRLACFSAAEPASNTEFRLRHKDGSYRHILSRGSAVLDADGTPVQIVGAHVDITEWTALQARLRQTQKIETVGQLAGGIAHDFNNLLTVINGTAELAVAQLPEGEPLRLDLEEIRRAGERAAALTNQLLAFSRKEILQPQVLNLNTIVGDMETMLRRLIGEDIDLMVVPAEVLGSVKADPGQMEQLIANLAVNARDAMPRGGQLTVETRNIEIDEDYARRRGAAVQPGPYVMLAVSDSGVGMNDVTRGRAFEPFFTTKAPGKGTGLGLSTVFGIVQQSNGFIWLHSEVGRGTCVTTCLPQVADVAGGGQRPSTGASPVGAETILVVEDVEGLRHLARRILESAGYTVLTAASGGEALILLERREQPVHLMVTDVVMPGMSGRALVEECGRTQPGVKVLYMSGYTSDITLRHGVSDALAPYLSKPFTTVGLLRKVREVLDSSCP